MTENTPDDPTRSIAAWRGQLQAVELCRAVSDGEITAADRIFDHEQTSGQLRELVSALTTFAVSLARTVAANDPTITEHAVWSGLATRAETGLLGTAEIDEITNPKENDQ